MDFIKRKLSVLILIALILAVDIKDVFAQEEGDTVVVRTLTFDDITKRRGTWSFPDNPGEYRKILMNYKLKCDRQTAQDIYDCGEWDYLAYAILYQHMGVMDSSLVTSPKYNWGRGIPDTMFYITEPTYTTYQGTRNKIIYDNIANETETVIGTGEETMLLENKPTKIQILLSKDYCKENELQKMSFQRMKLNSNSSGITLKNFKISAISSSEKELDEFEDGTTTLLYEGDYTFTEGWNYIDFLNDFEIRSLFGVIIQLSYDGIEGGDGLELKADSFDNALITNESDSYLEFDGNYDHVNCGVIDELNGVQKFTVEMRIKMNAWRNNGFFFKLGDALYLKTAEEYNQPKRYYWRVQDGDDFGIYVGGTVNYGGSWDHFAFVYDGTQEQYDGKLKFYINGSLITGYIRGKFPDALPDADKILKLISEGNNVNADMDEFRIWTDALDKETIDTWQNTGLNSSHPAWDKLAVYYSMNNIEDYTLADESGNGHDGMLIGAPAVRTIASEDMKKNIGPFNYMPYITLVQGEYESHTEEETISTQVMNSPMSIVTYRMEDKTAVIDNIEYVWEPGTFYTYNPDGEAIDSVKKDYTDITVQDAYEYYSEPAEVLNPWELARYITPYGKLLELGDDGFTWQFDVTDYAPLLTGEVDLAAHNQQELIDLEFLFIKGTPARDVISIDQIWGPYKSYKYSALDNDEVLRNQTIELNPDAKQFKVKTRLTGHGHNSNDGSYPHCCEWKDNTHYLAVNSSLYEWHIYTDEVCTRNPVFPQGGTWPQEREGWCPGDVVKDYEFEITDDIDGNTVDIDYAISEVPSNNQGMGNGNYVVAMQLVQYGDFNFNNDLEVMDVIIPSNNQLYSRINPACSSPVIEIRNNGRNEINSINFEFHVGEERADRYEWEPSNGETVIKPHETSLITLPVEDNKFWLSDINEFHVDITGINGGDDDYEGNNHYMTNFDLPDLYNASPVVQVITNKRPTDFELKIYDTEGNIVYEKTGFKAEHLHDLEINLPKGCYNLVFTDDYEYGLYYWAYPEAGSGAFKFTDASGNVLKNFDPSFGQSIEYSFSIGDAQFIHEPNMIEEINVYPNPANSDLNIYTGPLFGTTDITIYDELGRLVLSNQFNLKFNDTVTMNIESLPAGVYSMRILSDNHSIFRKFVKE